MTPAKTCAQWVATWNNLARALASQPARWAHMSDTEIEAALFLLDNARKGAN